MRALARELEREAGQRERFYPDRVAKGRMLEADASRNIIVAHAWIEDARRIRQCWFDAPGTPPAPPAHGVDWHSRRFYLLRELELRARVYPRSIAEGKLLEADARQRTACLEALLAIYEDGWDFPGSEADYLALLAEVRQRNAVQSELGL